MIDTWTVIRWIHLIAAITWIGGMIFLILVVVPVLRVSVPSPEERTLLTGRVGRRYGIISAVALATLIATGFLNAEHAQVDWGDLRATEYGETLLIKLILVAFVVVITLVHSLYFGFKLERLARESKDVQDSDYLASRARIQRTGIVLSGVNLLLNLIIVLFAAALVT